MNNIEELKRRALAATPGPWKFGTYGRRQHINESVAVEPYDYRAGRYYGVFGAKEEMVVGCDEYDVFRNTADKAFLTAANPDVVLSLIATIEAQQDALVKCVKLLKFPCFASANDRDAAIAEAERHIK